MNNIQKLPPRTYYKFKNIHAHRDLLKNKQGVYWIVFRSKKEIKILCYVGESCDLYERLCTHFENTKDCGRKFRKKITREMLKGSFGEKTKLALLYELIGEDIDDFYFTFEYTNGYTEEERIRKEEEQIQYYKPRFNFKGLYKTVSVPEQKDVFVDVECNNTIYNSDDSAFDDGVSIIYLVTNENNIPNVIMRMNEETVNILKDNKINVVKCRKKDLYMIPENEKNKMFRCFNDRNIAYRRSIRLERTNNESLKELMESLLSIPKVNQSPTMM